MFKLKQIHVCGIFKVQLKLVPTSKHDLHYGQYSQLWQMYSQCFSVLQNESNTMHFKTLSQGL
jgi:hypothetical protein